jgi:hypothetical protein
LTPMHHVPVFEDARTQNSFIIRSLAWLVNGPDVATV